MRMFYKISVITIFAVLLSGSIFAQTEREKGLKLYKEGKNKEAVAVLEKESEKSETDAETWNALGLAYLRDDSTKKAVKAFEKAVNLNQQNAYYHTNLAYAYLQNGKANKAQSESTRAIALNPKIALAYFIRGTANLYEGDNREVLLDSDRTIKADPNYSAAYTLKSDAMLNQFGNRIGGGAKPIDEINLLEQAKEVLENCLKNCRNNPQSELQQKRLDTLNIFQEYFSKNRDVSLGEITKNPVATTVSKLPSDPNITPIEILKKPFPSYTDKARSENISGTVTLAIFFSEIGIVTHALVLKGLGGGLTENALRAAYSIKFNPPTRNGKPFSQIKTVTYSFKIY